MNSRENRRGRPKLNKPTFDLGTLEIQKKRCELSLGDPSNTKLSESLLGIFYARGLISKDLYDAGTHYYSLGYRFQPQLRLSLTQRRSHLATLGEPKAPSARMFEDNNDQSHDEKIAAQWKGANDALRQTGVRVTTMVTLVTFYEGDLFDDAARILKKLTPHHIVDLRIGLTRLGDFFKLSRVQKNI